MQKIVIVGQYVGRLVRDEPALCCSTRTPSGAGGSAADQDCLVLDGMDFATGIRCRRYFATAQRGLERL